MGHGGSALPLKQCYCEVGYFGQNCQLESPLKEKKINASAPYEEIKLLGEDFKFLWRYIGGSNDEIEGVIVAKTMGYVAIGWRPDGITKGCQKFPTDAPAPRSRDFHAMDCQDIVIGKVKGDLSNIGDYYTRDRLGCRFRLCVCLTWFFAGQLRDETRFTAETTTWQPPLVGRKMESQRSCSGSL